MTFPALLQEKSENVLKVVNESAQNVIRIVRFSTNTTANPELKISFKSDCGKLTEMKPTSFCDNVEEGKRYTFEVTLELTKLIEHNSETTKTITIEEQNIQQEITLDLEYVGQRCKCSNENKHHGGDIEICNHHGEYRCGACYCHEGWTGRNCDEECGQIDDQESCREIVDSYLSPVCYLKYWCRHFVSHALFDTSFYF